MFPQQILDPYPIFAVLLAFIVLALLAYEVGFRAGRWWQRRTPDEKEGPTAMLVGSLLALLAFLLAVTMGMASDRYDTRRALVLQEANAIGTTYLRAGYLPAPYREEIRTLLREYAPLRANPGEYEAYAANLARTTAIQDEIWAMTEELARATPDSDVLALFIETLNETIDLQESRTIAVIYARVPSTILAILFIGQLIAVGMVGYNAGLTGKRSMVSAVVLVVVLSAVLTLIVDLDKSRAGLVQVSQQPILDLIEAIGPP